MKIGYYLTEDYQLHILDYSNQTTPIIELDNKNIILLSIPDNSYYVKCSNNKLETLIIGDNVDIVICRNNPNLIKIIIPDTTKHLFCDLIAIDANYNEWMNHKCDITNRNPFL